MDIIETSIDTTDKEYKENFTHYKNMVADLKDKIKVTQQGGGKEKIKLHKSRNKLLARERIEELLDPDTPFIEFNQLAAYNLFENRAPGAGIVTGIGIIHGQEVVIVANDSYHYDRFSKTHI